MQWCGEKNTVSMCSTEVKSASVISLGLNPCIWLRWCNIAEAVRCRSWVGTVHPAQRLRLPPGVAYLWRAARGTTPDLRGWPLTSDCRGEQRTATKRRIDNFTRFKDRNKRSLTCPCAFHTLGILRNCPGRKIDDVFFSLSFFVAHPTGIRNQHAAASLERCQASHCATTGSRHPFYPWNGPSQLAHQLIHTSTVLR